MIRDAPVEVKPARLVSYRLSLAILLGGLCPLIESLLLDDFIIEPYMAEQKSSKPKAHHVHLLLDDS